MANLLTTNHDSGASCYEEQLTANLVGKCRTEEKDGVKYLVAKITALLLVVFALTTAQVSNAARLAPEESEPYRPAASSLLGDAQGASVMPELNWDTGVYCIRNVVNGKRYVGSSAKDLMRRIRNHKKSLNQQTHCNRHLQRAWNSYGTKNFRFSILERCSPAQCLVREQYWMDLYKSADAGLGYNISPTAGSPLGVKHTAETKAKVSAASKGRTHTVSEETRQRMSEIAKQRPPMSAETRAKVAAAGRGRKHSEATRLKISIANKGHTTSEETRRKIGLASTGKPQSAEARAKNAASQKIRYLSQEERDRTRLTTSQGIRNSPQAMANRSRAGKLRWIKRREIA